MAEHVHPREQELGVALAAALASLLGSKTESAAEAREASDASSAEWTVEIRLSGTLDGGIVAAFSAESATALATIWVGEEPPEAQLGDQLQALWLALAASVDAHDEFDGLALSVESCARAPEDPPLGPLTWYELTVGDRVIPVGFLVELVEQVEHPTVAEDAAAVLPQGLPANLEVVLDIDLPLAIQFGHTEMTLASLSGVGPGSIIELDRAPEEPVDVMVNGHLVARGEVVVVSGNYGVRVTEVVSAADRLRSLGA